MYEWLLDYQNLQEEINYLEYQLNRNKRELKRWSIGDLSKIKLNEKSIASNLEERIADYEHELAHKLNDQYDAKKLIYTFKGLENQILYYRYVEGMKLIDVADQLELSPNYIYSKHAEIMKRIKFAENLTFS